MRPREDDSGCIFRRCSLGDDNGGPGETDMDLVAEELGLKAQPSSGFVARMASRCWPRRSVTFFFGLDFFFSLFQALWMFKVRIYLSLYHRLPFNTLSRAWGSVLSVNLPVWLRAPTILFYVWYYKCDLQEAACEDPSEYRNLSEFFRRKLKPELRPIDPTVCLTSPADGRVLHFGRVEAGHLEQVKGIKYTMQDFLGPPPKGCPLAESDSLGRPINRVVLSNEYSEVVKTHEGTSLFHCVIYLAPGDYHCFHSPTDWEITYRRHFPGHLMAVRPPIVNWVRGLFAINERVVYFGKWRHGFFSMTPVGATNVGSIRVLGDEMLRTNVRRRDNTRYFEKSFDKSSFCARKGDMFGEFNFGSTVVLVFEAPSDFSFFVRPDGKIRMGEALGDAPI